MKNIKLVPEAQNSNSITINNGIYMSNGNIQTFHSSGGFMNIVNGNSMTSIGSNTFINGKRVGSGNMIIHSTNRNTCMDFTDGGVYINGIPAEEYARLNATTTSSEQSQPQPASMTIRLGENSSLNRIQLPDDMRCKVILESGARYSKGEDQANISVENV